MTPPAAPCAGRDRPESRPTETLSRAGRRLRVWATVIVAALFLLGSWRGGTDTFPFGVSSPSTGRMVPAGDADAPYVQALTADGSLVDVGAAESGFGPGELTGQLPALTRDPGRLRTIAVAHHRRVPGAPSYVGVRIVLRRYHVRNHRVHSYTDRVVAEWGQSSATPSPGTH